MIFKRMRVNGGKSHDSLKVASALSVKVMEIQTSGGEIIETLKELKDADPADSTMRLSTQRRSKTLSSKTWSL